MPLTTISRYDDKDRPVMTLPPATTDTDAGLIFTTEYYGNDLVRFEKVPGRDVVEYRYNDRDLLMAYQDGYLRAQAGLQWISIAYDLYGRPTAEGFTSIALANNSTIHPSIGTADELVVTQYNATGIHRDKVQWRKTRVLLPDGSLAIICSDTTTTTSVDASPVRQRAIY